MTMHKCRTSWCVEYLPQPGWCAAHTKAADEVKKVRDSAYDRRNRDVEMKRFYASPLWRQVRAMVLADHPICQRCKEKPATVVHHTTPAKQLAPAERLNRRTLEGLCDGCHSKHESQHGADVYRYADPFAAANEGGSIKTGF